MGQVGTSAIDPVEGKIYWSQIDPSPPGQGIYRVNLDGSDAERVLFAKDMDMMLTEDPTNPQGPYFPGHFSLDAVGKKLYWSGWAWINNSAVSFIVRANLDGSNMERLIYSAYRPMVDEARRKLYFQFVFPFGPEGFFRSNLDGSDKELLFRYDRPFQDLLLDSAGQKLYYTIDGNKAIRRLNLDGSEETLIERAAPPRHLAVDSVGKKIYWMEDTRNRLEKSGDEIVYRANLDGSNIEVVLTEDAYKGGFTFSETAPSDLAVESFQLINSTLVPGERFTLSGIVRNKGRGAASPTTLRYYRSNNEAGTLGGKEVGKGDVPSLASDEASDVSIVLTAPTTLGTYYYRACVSGGSGERILDNNCTPPIKVTVKTESDLAFKSFVTNIKTDNNTLKPGESFRLAIIATNRGKGESSPTTLRYYRSTDENFTSDDTEVGKTDVSSLRVGSIKRHRVLITAPTVPGVYYYGACIDRVGEERVIDNNCTAAIKVTVALEPEVLIPAAQRPPLYWIDPQAGTLHRLIGAKLEALLPDVQNVTSLAVDMAGGKLYWAEKINARTGRIRTANLDGSTVKLVKALTSVPLDIAVDTAGGTLYLLNAWGKVQRMNLDGSNFQPNLIVDLASPGAFGVRCWTR